MGRGRNQSCKSCKALRAELATCHERIATLESEAEDLRAQLSQASDLIELQRADLDRYKAEYERIRPNTPERVPSNQLQLAFERVLESMSDVPAAQDLAAAAAAAAANDDDESDGSDDEQRKSPKGKKGKGQKNRHPHSRRRLDLTNLAVEEIVRDPDEVVAAGGEGFDLVGEEVSDRVAFKPASWVRLRIVRRTWVRKVEVAPRTIAAPTEELPRPIITAPLPDSVWPSFMADPSAPAHHIISKYGDYLPLNRQEGISARTGFRVPRSTQCGWLGESYRVLYRIVDAMFAESTARAFCIATDATGAPVRAPGACEKWHIFVFIADRDHVVFRYSEEHSSEAMQTMLGGYRGHLLSDAAAVYDTLHRDGAIEVCCWFHLRRYFWRGLPTDPQRALEALSLIAKLFEIQRECHGLPLPEYTAQRAARSEPVLELFEEWTTRNRDAVDPRGPLHQGIGYYDNQREGLRRFLEDGRLRLDNSISEQQLRAAVLGRHNWMFFANETGLKWYTTFRSLIASCVVHDINAHEYLEQVLRLAPHWPVSRVLELSPKYWKATVAGLDDSQRRILVAPWEAEWPRVDATGPPGRRADRRSA